MNDETQDPARRAALAADPPQEVPLVHVDSLAAGRPDGAPLVSAVGLKLAASLFLHNICIGSWFVTLGSYVAANAGASGAGMFTEGFVGIAYSAGPLGGMISPFVTGMLADRWFAAERLMAVLQLLCAAALGGAILATSQDAFFAALFTYFLFFHPCGSLTTSMALHHLARPERDFPAVRACGTVGWIAAGVLVGWVWPAATGHSIEGTVVPMKVGIVASLVMAGLCLTLPHTPPGGRAAAREKSEAPGRGRTELKNLVCDGRFAGLMLLAVLAHIPSQFYYAYSNVFFNGLGMTSTAAKMTLGQLVEVGVMLMLPATLLRIGVRWAVVAGLALWSLRYFMMAAATDPRLAAGPALLYASIALHGVAFTLVTISLQLDVDRCAGRGRRATAQGLFSVAVQGFGCFTGAQLAGLAEGAWLHKGSASMPAEGWQTFWLAPAVASAAIGVLAFAILRGESGAEEPAAGG